jgi:hypothetical protein
MVLIILVLLGVIGVIIYFAIPKAPPCPNPPCTNVTAAAGSALGRALGWALPEPLQLRHAAAPQ